MDRRLKTIVFFSQTGCLLPLLLLLNLFFGWMFFSFLVWLGIELGLVAFFLVNSMIIARKISKFSELHRTGKEVVDIEGEIITKDKDNFPPNLLK